MSTQATIPIHVGLLKIINNLYEIDRKLTLHGDIGNAMRNVEKIKDALGGIYAAGAELEFFYEDPMGQMFKETRTDLDATITGDSSEDLYVVEVIKPIIRARLSGVSHVIQKGSVIVASKNNEVGNG